MPASPGWTDRCPCIATSKPAQAYSEAGSAIVFLCWRSQYQALGQPKYLEPATKLFELKLRWKPDAFAHGDAGKDGLGAVIYFTIAGDERAKKAACGEADFLCAPYTSTVADASTASPTASSSASAMPPNAVPGCRKSPPRWPAPHLDRPAPRRVKPMSQATEKIRPGLVGCGSRRRYLSYAARGSGQFELVACAEIKVVVTRIPSGDTRTPGLRGHQAKQASGLEAAGLELLACADISAEGASSTGEDCGFRQAFADYERMLTDPGLEAVVVAATHDHLQAAALAVVGAGKQVLVEKPIALNAEQARQLLQAAAPAGDWGLLGSPLALLRRAASSKPSSTPGPQAKSARSSPGAAWAASADGSPRRLAAAQA